MAKLLNVQSSPNLMSSASRAASKIFVETFLEADPDGVVTDVDLVRNPPPHIGADHLGAFFAPPEFHSAENTAALRASETYLAQLFAADVVLVGTPMHNLGIASVLKSWVDNVLRIGRTFKYDETGQAVGLLPPHIKVVIMVASGGIYSAGAMQQFEFAGNYLTAVFGFMGVTEVEVIRAEGLTMGPQMAEAGIAHATAAARDSARAMTPRLQPAFVAA
jgi:FMN-dependent NADH-azoreductase